jgi:hypothetical protein
MQSRLTQKQR